MPITTDKVTQKIQERLTDVHELVRRIEKAREKSESGLEKIIEIRDKTKVEENLDSSENQKLKSALNKAIDDAKKEENLLRNALAKINEIRSIRDERRLQARNAGNKETVRRATLMKMLHISAQTLPLYIGKNPGDKAPSLCGCVPAEPNYIAKPGDMVASIVKNAEGEQNWILAEVISYDESTMRYVIEDVDEEEKKKYSVSRRRSMPLPLMKANPETDAEALFPLKKLVMALYPQTTCFYKARVYERPATAQEDYVLRFVDSTFEGGLSPPLPVPQRYVLPFRDLKRKVNVGDN